MIKNAIFLFVLLAAVFVLYLPSYMQMQNLRGRNLAFEQRIRDLESETARLTVERERLIKDPEYFERVARERMGLIKEDEVIYKVVPPGTKKAEAAEEAKEALEKKAEPPKPPVKKKKKKTAKPKAPVVVDKSSGQ